MLHTPPPCAAPDAACAEPDLARRPAAVRALVERQVAALTELTEIGMDIARAAGRGAVSALEGEAPAAGGAARPDPSLAYAHAARAVRMCIALQARLLNDLPALERGESQARSEQRHARKKQIVHLVKQVSETEHGDEVAQISREAWERLRDADEYSAMMTLPLAQAVARICKDLDVTPDWSLWGGDPIDLPPLGEVPDEVGGRGLQGAEARDSALQPSSSASKPLPPAREDQTALNPWRSAQRPAGPCGQHRAGPSTPRSG